MGSLKNVTCSRRLPGFLFTPSAGLPVHAVCRAYRQQYNDEGSLNSTARHPCEFVSQGERQGNAQLINRLEPRLQKIQQGRGGEYPCQAEMRVRETIDL